ncbi:hypothetical protein CAPTEDRAFT_211609 [Capitella teleta]|uniref:G-protein coupled receptors family 1 profile domain-containing protein n=1 Tax=Capitella teleta TaxID=283909 RepID=R7UMP3_CAPTE|nr:hypothetical protein CAPTEDRAFT_211609 [Capitella teleta]|eukprot:ELU05197.1 hypothetical protein CAPTEDRAFT_211609 [Capitella teleta]
MANLTVFSAAVLWLITTGIAQETTIADEITEPPIDQYMVWVLANPVQFSKNMGYSFNDVNCPLYLLYQLKWPFHVIRCVCFLNCVGIRELTQEEYDFRYQVTKEIRQSNVPTILRRKWHWILLYTVFTALGIIGNITLIIVIFKFLSKKKSSTNVLIASIAVSDLLASLICLPITAYEGILGAGFMGRHIMMLVLCKMVHFLYYTSFTCSILSMLAMGIERFLVICFPLRAASIMTIGNMKKGVGCIWLLAAANASPAFYLYTQDNGEPCKVSIYERRTYQAYMGWNLFTVYTAPALILTYIYSRVVLTLKQSIDVTRDMRTKNNAESDTKVEDDEDIRGRKQFRDRCSESNFDSDKFKAIPDRVCKSIWNQVIREEDGKAINDDDDFYAEE